MPPHMGGANHAARSCFSPTCPIIDTSADVFYACAKKCFKEIILAKRQIEYVLYELADIKHNGRLRDGD